MNISHKQKTVSALKWSLLNQLISQGAIFVIGVILMREIDPNQFGLLGMVTVITGFFNVFRDFGLSSSLIQHKSITDVDKNTLFWFSLFIGIFLATLLFLSSYAIGAFYNEKQLVSLTQTIAIVFIIQSISNTPNALLTKQMQFDKLFWVNTSSVVIAGSAAIMLAINNYGVWALIYQQIIAATVALVMLWILIDFRPKFFFSSTILKKHLKFGGPLLGTQTINYWARNSDNLLIGKFLGTAPLGLYSRAYSIMMLPIANVSRVISNVMFPSFSQIQEDREQIKTIYLKMVRVIAFVTFPMMGILFLVAEPLTLLVFGERWKELIPLIKILSIVGALQSIGTLNGNIFLSQGKTKLQFKINIITGALVATTFAIAVQYNIAIVAKAYLGVTLLIIVPVWYIMGKLIALKLGEIIQNITPHLFSVLLIVLLGIQFLQYISTFDKVYQIGIISVYFVFSWVILFRIVSYQNLVEIRKILQSVISTNF